MFPVVGAAGGAVAGYFLLDNNNLTTWSVFSLSAGLALIVPAVVITLAATAYSPHDEATSIGATDGGGGGSGPAPGRTGGGAPPEGTDSPATPSAAPTGGAAAGGQALLDRERLLRAGPGLLRFSGDALYLGVPGVSVAASLTPAEKLRYGGRDTTEVHVALVSGVF